MPAMPAEPPLAEKNDSAPVCFLKSSPVYPPFCHLEQSKFTSKKKKKKRREL